MHEMDWKYTWKDFKRNQGIVNELKIESALTKILDYRNKWIYLINTMQRDRLTEVVMKYKSAGTENQRKPLKRLLDNWGKNGSTNEPTDFFTVW
jgi:hypothetical protein